MATMRRNPPECPDRPAPGRPRLESPLPPRPRSLRQSARSALGGHSNRSFAVLALTALLLAALAVCPSARSATPPAGRWIATWGASPQRGFAGPQGAPPELAGRTVRQRVRVSLGGQRLRVRFSNEFGSQPLTIGAATVATPTARDSINADSVRSLTFGGRKSVVIPAGAPVLSDPVDFEVSAGGEVAISLFTPQPIETLTLHDVGASTTVVSPPGDFTATSHIESASTTTNRPLVTAVLVPLVRNAAVVVALGDSITDGTRSTVDADHRWPDFLVRRALSRGGKGRPIAVINQGISGNQLRRDGAGVSALTRFDRDVLAVPGVTHVVVLEGINDIGWPGARLGNMLLLDPREMPTTEDIIGAYQQLIARAHAHGIKIIGATLTPFEGTDAPGYYSPQKEPIRLAVNQWIRTSGAFDAVIDFDALIRDPQHPSRVLPRYVSDDNLHPSDDGYRAMGESVPLTLFD